MENLNLKKLLKHSRKIFVLWVRQRFPGYDTKSTSYKRTN